MLRQMVVWAWALLVLCGSSAWAKEKKKPDFTPIELTTDEESAAVAKIRAALKEKTEFEFVETPLVDVVKFIRKHHQIAVQVDVKALGDASIEPETPVTRQSDHTTLKSALRMTLGALDLTYIIKNEVLLITTPDKASNELTIKVYPISDLAVPNPASLGGEEVKPLIATIKTSVAPTTWDEVGGPGSITFSRESRSLVVSQTQEVHEEVFTLLTALRKARDRQDPAPPPTLMGTLIERWENDARAKAQLRSSTFAFFASIPRL